MSYTVLARRYRSTSFDELVGQEAIARTLMGAIEQGRVAHAYLFIGARGVGKTSTARIFAKALNGGSPEVDKAIMTGQDTDVIEIDAASHNKVEEARDLIANSIYRPLRGKYKIYIIDEVHMLSTPAFNALLKTMEEPPEHVKFILCTTESQKVPATIQSRCQRYDFRNIPASLIAEHLTNVIKEEGMKAEPDLIHLVARMGAGSMRDALSLLDRLMAAGEKKLTVELLENLLGLPDRQVISSLIDALADGDAKTALELTDQLLARGVAIDLFIESLTGALRDLMVLAACGPETMLVDIAGDARKRAFEQSRRFDAAGLVHMIALCENAHRSSKYSSMPRAVLDALIARLAMAEKLADVAALLASGAGAPAPASASRGSPRKKA
ncbi:MAG: DNA polymerase III subunit gamma/tau [Phycisphaeraceae bacterium]|nr:MAG: DNA polymerase III subunit gamma/tau [Phycisphaeraceae bacterium]